MTKKVYIAGDMLTKSSQMLRAKEREDIKEIGLPFYNPADNKDINDKSKVNNDGLAERIVKADTDAIIESDIIVIEPLTHALGTHIELGQVLGMVDLANMILDIAEEDAQPMVILAKILELAEKMANKKVYPHYEDIRRFAGAGKDEEGDRRSLGINQYVYGACLKLTDGKGFFEWEEILDELKKIKNDPTL